MHEELISNLLKKFKQIEDIIERNQLELQQRLLTLEKKVEKLSKSENNLDYLKDLNSDILKKIVKLENKDRETLKEEVQRPSKTYIEIKRLLETSTENQQNSHKLLEEIKFLVKN